MSAKGNVTHITLFVCLGKGSASEGLGSHPGFRLVNTRLRARDPESLDAVYRVIETGALGLVARKSFYFISENEGEIGAAVSAFIPTYKGAGLAGPVVYYGRPKFTRRRSYERLVSVLRTEHATQEASKLLERMFGSLFGENRMVPPKAALGLINLDESLDEIAKVHAVSKQG